MYPYIICFCGRSLGDIYDLFIAMRVKKFRQVYNDVCPTNPIDPIQLQFDPNIVIELDDIFRALHIELPCCRVRLMTQIQLKNLY